MRDVIMTIHNTPKLTYWTFRQNVFKQFSSNSRPESRSYECRFTFITSDAMSKRQRYIFASTSFRWIEPDILVYLVFPLMFNDNFPHLNAMLISRLYIICKEISKSTCIYTHSSIILKFLILSTIWAWFFFKKSIMYASQNFCIDSIGYLPGIQLHDIALPLRVL